MPATRIHGDPGHLIVEVWPPDEYEYDDFFVNHGISRHTEDAQKLFDFFSNHVSFAYTIRKLYWLLKREFPEWDSGEESGEEREED